MIDDKYASKTAFAAGPVYSTSPEAAAQELGMCLRWVQNMAKKHNVGHREGRQLRLTKRDVQRLRQIRGRR